MTVLKMDVIAANGVPFRAVLLTDGVSENYGKLNDNGKPEIEFYDMRDKHTSDGQFTGARYYTETLLEDRGWYPGKVGGLNLHGGVDDWTLDDEVYQQILDWVVTSLDRADKPV
ncbi:hypothetical protein SEA_PHREDRICK_252 [Streptomyces phage Phredrick]|nr:hypothetical protein SEA_PHREDRICK_252 [Streptomyces phage Phredrick]